MLQWFQALMPKEEKFVELFAQHSRAVVAGAIALRAMMEGGDALSRNYQVVMDREHDAAMVSSADAEGRKVRRTFRPALARRRCGRHRAAGDDGRRRRAQPQ